MPAAPVQAAPMQAAHMRAALALARRGLGTVWPNPAVGCLLTVDDLPVGRGWTQPGGRPHAETEALARAGKGAPGATAYVTLEPCDHHGETPPCSEALVAAGIGAAVIAVEDPDPRVSGRGIQRLRDAGIRVATGLCAEEARRLNAGYFLRVTEGRPLFTLKTATTLDGRIATRTGDSRWVTGETARAFAHRMRADHDAVMIGIGTALADQPRLTCRLPGLEERSPVRLVMDSALRLPLDSRLVETAAQVPCWLIAAAGAAPDRRRALEARGVIVIEVEADASGRPSVALVATELGRRGLTRVLVEGGGGLAASLLEAGLVDRLAWFRNPRVMGGDGVPAAAPFGLDALANAPGFVRTGVVEADGDILETYEKAS